MLRPNVQAEGVDYPERAVRKAHTAPLVQPLVRVHMLIGDAEYAEAEPRGPGASGTGSYPAHEIAVRGIIVGQVVAIHAALVEESPESFGYADELLFAREAGQGRDEGYGDVVGLLELLMRLLAPQIFAVGQAGRRHRLEICAISDRDISVKEVAQLCRHCRVDVPRVRRTAGRTGRIDLMRFGVGGGVVMGMGPGGRMGNVGRLGGKRRHACGVGQLGSLGRSRQLRGRAFLALDEGASGECERKKHECGRENLHGALLALVWDRSSFRSSFYRRVRKQEGFYKAL